MFSAFTECTQLTSIFQKGWNDWLFMWLQLFISLSDNDTYANIRKSQVNSNWYLIYLGEWFGGWVQDESVSLNGELFGAPESFPGRCLEKDLTPENFRPVCPASTLDIVDDLMEFQKLFPFSFPSFYICLPSMVSWWWSKVKFDGFTEIYRNSLDMFLVVVGFF